LIRGINNRSPTWQQARLLLLAGLVIGYPSLIGATRGMWGGDASPHQGLCAAFFFASAVAFLSGFASFLSITVKALTSPTGAELAAASPPPATPGGVSRAASPHIALDTIANRKAFISSSAALTILRLTLVAVVCLATYFVLLDWGRPPLSSSYGRAYWLIAVITLLLGRVPFAVALIRTWKVPDRAGLALAMIGGTADLLYLWDRSARSPWLTASFGLATVALAYFVWRPSLSRKGDVGLLISIFFGFAAYAALTRIAVLILASRLRV
jgi:hypothetical protein